MKRLQALWKNAERGQALVEFAMVGLIFFIVVFGTIDVGRAVWNYNTLSQATREGARFAVVHGDRCDASAGCSAADLDHVTVTSEYDYAPMSFFTGLFSLPSVTMTSTSTMEIHY